MEQTSTLNLPHSIRKNLHKDLGFFRMMIEDIRCAQHRDPAARNGWEVFFNYAGLHAIWAYRITHWLWLHKVYFLARWLSQVSAMDHRGGNPPWRKNRPALFHRPRHGCGDRRNG